MEVGDCKGHVLSKGDDVVIVTRSPEDSLVFCVLKGGVSHSFM